MNHAEAKVADRVVVVPARSVGEVPRKAEAIPGIADQARQGIRNGGDIPAAPTPTAGAIGHLAIRVKDVERSLDFYVHTLGFKEMMRLERDGALWLVYLRVTDEQFLEIFPAGEGDPALPRETVGHNHMCLVVPDIDQCVREIEAAGIPFYRPEVRQADDNWQCWIRDPDEHRIELMQMTDDSLQGAAIARLRTT